MTGRLVALLLVAGLAAGGAACGSGEPTAGAGGAAQREVVRIWIMNNGPQPVADLERIVKPFETKSGVDVRVELVGWDVQFDRIRSAAATGRGPDLTQAGTTQVPFFASLGGFEDLSNRIADIGGADAYADGVFATTQVQGLEGTWAVPWFTEARALYYRLDALRHAGVDPATAFTDWQAFRRTLAALKRRPLGQMEPFGGPGAKAFDLLHNVAPFVWGAGGAELSRDATRSTIDSRAAARGVGFAAGLVRDGLWSRSSIRDDGTTVETNFKEGRFAAWAGGPWVLASARRSEDTNWDDAARENVRAVPFPAGPSGRRTTFVGGSNLMMLRSSKHKQAAWKLMAYLSQDSVQREYAALLGMFPARLDPQAAAGTASADHRTFAQAIREGRTYAPLAEWAQVENVYRTHLGRVLDRAAAGEASAAAVTRQLRKAAREADAVLVRKGA